MYLSFYNLEREPFGITPDPAFLFLSDGHKEALASVIYGVDKRKGFIALTGEVGTGKTTMLRSFLASMDRDRTKPVYIFNANLTFEELLRAIFRELELDCDGLSVNGMVGRLHEFLIGEYSAGRNIVVIIDEAQNSPVETLENLRMLSNLESTGDKLIQIVLSGQPELNDKLGLHELRQLKQRIAVRAEVGQLTRRESFDYIEHRLSVSSAGGGICFSRGALKRIVAESKGFPRMLNILCDNALVSGYGYQIRPVNARIAQEAIADYRGSSAGLGLKRYFRLAATVLIVVGVLATAYHYVPDWTGVARLVVAEQTGKEEPKGVIELPARIEPVETEHLAPVVPDPEPEVPTVVVVTKRTPEPEVPVVVVAAETAEEPARETIIDWASRAALTKGISERIARQGIPPLSLYIGSPLYLRYRGPLGTTSEERPKPLAEKEIKKPKVERKIAAEPVVIPLPPEETIKEPVESAESVTPIQESPINPALWALPEI